MKKPFIILLDSSTTVPKDIAKKNNFKILPISLSDENDQVYPDDGILMNQEILIKMVEHGSHFKTSATPLGILMTTIEDLLKEYEKVIFIPISKGISSQYQQSLSLLEEYPNQLYVINSTNAVLINEAIAIKLTALLEKKTPIEEAIKQVEGIYNKSCTFFSCEDVSGMLSGGRVTKAITMVVKILKIKPIICLDDKNHLAGQGKLFEDIVYKMTKLIKKSFPSGILKPENIEYIAALEGECEPSKINAIIKVIATAFNLHESKILVRKVPTPVLVHTLKNSYGIAVVTNINKKSNFLKD